MAFNGNTESTIPFVASSGGEVVSSEEGGTDVVEMRGDTLYGPATLRSSSPRASSSLGPFQAPPPILDAPPTGGQIVDSSPAQNAHPEAGNVSQMIGMFEARSPRVPIASGTMSMQASALDAQPIEDGMEDFEGDLGKVLDDSDLEGMDAEVRVAYLAAVARQSSQIASPSLIVPSPTHEVDDVASLRASNASLRAQVEGITSSYTSLEVENAELHERIDDLTNRLVNRENEVREALEEFGESMVIMNTKIQQAQTARQADFDALEHRCSALERISRVLTNELKTERVARGVADARVVELERMSREATYASQAEHERPSVVQRDVHMKAAPDSSAPSERLFVRGAMLAVAQQSVAQSPAPSVQCGSPSVSCPSSVSPRSATPLPHGVSGESRTASCVPSRRPAIPPVFGPSAVGIPLNAPSAQRSSSLGSFVRSPNVTFADLPQDARQMSSNIARLRASVPENMRGFVDELSERMHRSSSRPSQQDPQQDSSHYPYVHSPSYNLAGAVPYPWQAQLDRPRESDTIVVPALPSCALDMTQWTMDVIRSTQAASGRHESQSLREWLNNARSEVDDPETYFDTACTPREFVSLENKLNVALRKVLEDPKDKALLTRIKHFDQLRFNRNQEPLGGRRVLREILAYHHVSAEALQQAALQAFWRMTWRGDDLSQRSEFCDEMVRTVDAARRGGVSDQQITCRLIDVLRESPRLSSALQAYLFTHQAAGKPHSWQDLQRIVISDIDKERNSRVSAIVVDGGSANRASGRNQPRTKPILPAGPAPDATSEHNDVLLKYPKLCHKFALGLCTRSNCRYEHLSIAPEDQALVRAACLAKQPSGGNSSLNSIASRQALRTARGEIGYCINWQSAKDCPNMPNCRWRHGTSKEELARVKALRASELSSASNVVPATCGIPSIQGA